MTGASGRIGSQLVRRLCEAGHQVRGFGLPGDKALDALGADVPVAVFRGDLGEPSSLEPAVSGVDIVCHLAAALTTHDVDDDRYVEVNFNGTYNLLNATRDHAPDAGRFVYVSSDAVYWPALTGQPDYLPVDENHPLVAGSVYGATKVGAEAMCRAFWRSYGLPFTIVRPTATASPEELIDPKSPFGRRWFLDSAIAWLQTRAQDGRSEGLLRELLSIEKRAQKLLLRTDLKGRSSLTMITDARDIARAIHLMIESPDAEGEAFNVGPSAPHTERQIVEEIGRVLNLEVVEISDSELRPSWYVSSSKARGTLGYQPKWTVFEMIAEAVGATTR